MNSRWQVSDVTNAFRRIWKLSWRTRFGLDQTFRGLLPHADFDGAGNAVCSTPGDGHSRVVLGGSSTLPHSVSAQPTRARILVSNTNSGRLPLLWTWFSVL